MKKVFLLFCLLGCYLSAYGTIKWGGANQLFAIPNKAGWCVSENVTHDYAHYFGLKQVFDDIGMCKITDRSCGKYFEISDYVNNNMVWQSFAVPLSRTRLQGILHINNSIDSTKYQNSVTYKECYNPILPDYTIRKNVWIWIVDAGKTKPTH